MNLLRASSVFAALTALSRLFGFARDILIANFLGAGMVSDAFFAAFRFPNLFRRIFAEGAFSAAFVPIFAERLEADGREGARRFAEEAFAILALIVLLFVLAFELAMPFAIYLIAHGFDAVPGKMELAVELTRIAFPYLFFVSLVSLQSGVLNSLGYFAAAAAAPILLNLTLIAAIVGFRGHLRHRRPRAGLGRVRRRARAVRLAGLVLPPRGHADQPAFAAHRAGRQAVGATHPAGGVRQQPLSDQHADLDQPGVGRFGRRDLVSLLRRPGWCSCPSA